MDRTLQYSSTALTGAHDFDVVAGTQHCLRPGRAWHDRSIDGDRDPALAGIDRLLCQQRSQRGELERFVLTVDPNVHLRSGLRHGSLPYSAAVALLTCRYWVNPTSVGVKRSIPNGRMAGTATPSRMRRAMASAVIGV